MSIVGPRGFQTDGLPYKGALLLQEEGPMTREDFQKMLQLSGAVEAVSGHTLHELKRQGLIQLCIHLTPLGRDRLRLTEERLALERPQCQSN